MFGVSKEISVVGINTLVDLIIGWGNPKFFLRCTVETTRGVQGTRDGDISVHIIQHGISRSAQVSWMWDTTSWPCILPRVLTGGTWTDRMDSDKAEERQEFARWLSTRDSRIAGERALRLLSSLWSSFVRASLKPKLVNCPPTYCVLPLVCTSNRAPELQFERRLSRTLHR